MSFVVAIGGGEIDRGETRVIDEHIIDMTGRSNPNVLFLPTASEDDRDYSDKFTDYYRSLGAIVTVLEVMNRKTTVGEVQDKVGDAHAIYAGGGRSLTLLDEWEACGLDVILQQRAADEDIILSGQSAGANCWFEYASSDSKRPTDPPEPKYTVINGIAVVRNTIISPHFKTEGDERKPALMEQMGERPHIVKGIGIDDGAAYVAELENGEVQRDYVVSADPEAGAVVYERRGNRLAEVPILSYTY